MRSDLRVVKMKFRKVLFFSKVIALKAPVKLEYRFNRI